MNKIPVSVGILTFNSAATLRRTLESVKEFDDLIVCDGGSSDETLEIAREFGARVIVQDAQFKNADGSLKDFAGVRNQCLDAAKHDWFLYIDSDETISEGLRDDIRRISEDALEGRPLVYRVPIGIMMEGRYITYSSNYPGYQHRFFNKQSGARFRKPVHERIAFDASVEVGTLASPWYVHSTPEEWKHYLREMAGYRAIEVERARGQSWGEYLRFVRINLRTSLVTLLRVLGVYLLHGFSNSLPVRGEMGRVLNPLLLIRDITRARLRL